MTTEERNQMNIQIEYTDLFCGEANYAWVRRFNLTVPNTLPDRTIKRMAKQLCDISGARGRWEDLGDVMQFKPYSSKTVLFVTFEPE